MLLPAAADACTILVISGRATADGRPLLWKNRDTDCRENEVLFSQAGEHSFVAVADAGNAAKVWMGVNDTGFAIVNSLSEDLSGGSTAGPGNGRFMKLALAQCATVAEFEQLLKATNTTGRRTKANFGVIDATGAACVFEAGHASFAKFDANASESGYLLRTNFAFTARKANENLPPLAEIYSGRRYLSAEKRCAALAGAEKFSVRRLLQHLARDLGATQEWKGEPLIDTSSTINRHKTTSAVVIQGVLPQEDARLATMWTILGEPVFSLAVPCWPHVPVAPQLHGGKSPALCAAADSLRQAGYEDETNLRTSALDAVWPQTLPAERANLERTRAALKQWREREWNQTQARQLHLRCAECAEAAFRKLAAGSRENVAPISAAGE